MEKYFHTCVVLCPLRANDSDTDSVKDDFDCKQNVTINEYIVEEIFWLKGGERRSWKFHQQSLDWPQV